VWKSSLWASIAGILVICSVFLFYFTAQFSEEFTGGVSISLTSQANTENIQEDLENFLENQGYQDTHISVNQDQEELTIKINADLESDEKITELSNDIQTFLLSNKVIQSTDELNGQTLIGPSVGEYMQSTAFKALIVGIILMIMYMLFAFGKIRKEIPAEVLVSTVFCVLVFDICVTLGAYGIWMMLNKTVQVDTIFITALLTIVAYGINDVIVIFDRIRENIIKGAKDKSMQIASVVEESLWQTMRRSIGTSFSTLLVLIGMFAFSGGASILQQFAFTVGMGIIISTCSSIFLGGSCTNLFMKVFKNKDSKK